MSRAIKFRAWDKVYEEYTTDKVLLAPDGRVISRYGFDSCDSFLTVNDVVIEFDTGLKDKNGKEIYEGDIVKDHNEWIAVIVWREKMAAFGIKWVDGVEDDFEFHLPCEVIGNIHENPELLGGEE